MAPWPEILAIVSIGLATVAFILGSGRSRRRALASVALLSISVLLLAAAAGRPRLILPAQSGAVDGGLLVVALDASESFWREPAVAETATRKIADQVDALSQSLGARTGWQGLLIEFSEAAAESAPVQTLPQLAENLRRFVPPSGGREGSRADRALSMSLARIRQDGGRGAVILLSDGNFHSDLSPDLVEAFQARGVPIHILAAGSSAPATGLVAANLGPEQSAGHPAVVRGAVFGGGTLEVAGVDGVEGQDIPEAKSLRAIRAETVFAERGLQPVRLTFTGLGGKQSRVLYTKVVGPARVLAFGDARWLDLLDPTEWNVTRGDPAAPPAPETFDIVVIDALVPEDFTAGFDRTLLSGAARTGLLIVNGGLRGSPEMPQRIADWNASDLGPILPVNSDPHAVRMTPPRRDVVILIDVSGSMGRSMGIAKGAAHVILDQLRPIDTLAILPFSDRSEPSFRRQMAEPEALSQARRFIDTLAASGGTAPDSALAEAARMRSNYCAYFFISDGGFDPPGTHPQCFTTAISTEGQHFPGGVAAWGQEVLLSSGSGLGSLKLTYFEPEPRIIYYRSEVFEPVPTSDVALFAGSPVAGLAATYPRADAEVLAIHEAPPPDPLLALRHDAERPEVATAVFLGPMPPNVRGEDVAALLTRLVGWKSPRRFDIRIGQTGGRLNFTVSALEADALASPFLSGVLALESGRRLGLGFVSRGAPGEFFASIPMPDLVGPMKAVLELSEQGQDTQFIPVTLLNSDLTTSMGRERLDFGIQLEAMRELSSGTGGQELSVEPIKISVADAPDSKIPLHPWLIAIAIALFSCSLWCKERE
ncbi:vWA domain-containing protein [Poseidonocella sedimentorum]|uniref:vWA domain-containing protein n=1 Tax=Poseidonocella sedimentorum TaxID=871652 RepID=UPI0015A68778|nr:VWA domain-containing protein [Poseidonocella sedimentorum]